MNNFFGYDVVEKLKFISFDDEQKTKSLNEIKSKTSSSSEASAVISSYLST